MITDDIQIDEKDELLEAIKEAQKKPDILPVLPENIPDELKTLKQWVVWRLEKRDGKWTKVPYSITGEKAKAGKPETWSSFEEVLHVYYDGKYDGIGYEFHTTDPFTGIDFDHYSERPEHAQNVQALAKVTYVEKSVSGNGYHAIIVGQIQPEYLGNATTGRKSNDLESYHSGRFFCVTGHKHEASQNNITNQQTQLNHLCELYWKKDIPELPDIPQTKEHKPVIREGINHFDDGLIGQIRGSQQRSKFNKLWEGNIEDYNGDQSRADCAMVSILKFWTNDTEQIKRIWLASGLYRDKLLRPDYVNRTIQNAICDKQYDTSSCCITEATTPTLTPDYSFADKITVKKVEWLWKGRLALGKTNMLSGEGGVGKGALMIDIASRISTGTPFPLTGDIVKGKVIILSAEDDPEDTIVPRLVAAKANLKNILLLKGKKDGTSISLDEDVCILEKMMKEHPDIKMIVIDPISAYTGKTRDEEVPVRNFLRPIERLAQQYHVCILLIKHFKKGICKAKERTSGTIAWTNSVRVALGVSPDPQNEAIKHLYLIKSNNAKMSKSVIYETISSDYDPDIVAIQWGEETEYKADDFCTVDPESTKISQAIDIIKEALADGKKPTIEIVQLCMDADISKKTVWRAKEKLHLKASKNGFQGQWYWELPEQGICIDNEV